MTRRIAVLGATGSIGASTLDVIARHQPQFRATVLTANQHVAALADLCAIHRPELAVIADATRKDELAAALATRHVRCAVDAGSEALTRAAAGDLADTVVAAVVGAAGLASTLAAARSGKRLLLANKEAIVMAGELLLAAVRAGGAQLLPIDSEHNALFQCLPGGRPDLAAAGVRRLTLTASGGPFRGRHRDELRAVTPEVACKHPKWSMGRKISVDSATLMNKGLEVIEAHHLFGAPAAMIDVLVHPESIVHALVEYRDGTQLAQLCQPDMRTAIAHALAWPQRIEAGVTALDLARVGSLHFERPDTDTFRCLPLARAALAAGGDATTILNAANEAAVAAFLDRRLPFLAIADVVEATLAALPAEPVRDIGGLIQRDLTARARATRIIAGFVPSGSPLPIGPA